MTEQQCSSKDLILPVFLDTNWLLDLFASLSDGFAFVEKFSSISSDLIENSKKGRFEFGIANFLNLLKFGVGGSIEKNISDENRTTIEKSKYHTYGSLLFKLRDTLFEMDLIKRTNRPDFQWESLRPSDFVEITGVFNPNPLLDSIVGMDKIFSLFGMLANQSVLKQIDKKNQNKNDKSNQFDHVKKMLSGLRDDIDSNEIKLYLVKSSCNLKYTIMVNLNIDYLRDRSMKELNYREFRLLGKVVNNLSDSNSTINLFRGTGLGVMDSTLLEKLIQPFSKAEEHGFKFPRIEGNIIGPILEVVPIAIYI